MDRKDRRRKNCQSKGGRGASQSCIALAPEVFQIDWVKRKSSFSAAPIEVKDETGADNETIFLAAQSCPYRAIVLEDADTGERLYPKRKSNKDNKYLSTLSPKWVALK